MYSMEIDNQSSIYCCFQPFLDLEQLHSPLFFSSTNVSQGNSQKHLGVTLYFKLTFNEHLDNVLPKISKTKGLKGKSLSRKSLSTI